MVLERINGPADLKALDAEELPALTEEIRSFIVEAVARTGGHLGSNLGAVELTLGLHRVFDSPKDTFVWDTGHQAYVHKIVTGRRNGFEKLRQAGGLSGYPSRTESDHDLVENSHASTALSWGYGIARARQGDPDAGRVVSIIGDGAMTGGMAFEGLNNIGHSNVPMVVILNDNGRSYAPTVSRLSSEVTRFRFSKRYEDYRRRIDPLIEKVPYGRRFADVGLDAIKQVVADDPSLQHFVEALGVRYFGPVDGHDHAALEAALVAARDHGDGPVLVHVLTQKGKGYAPAETDPEKKLHDTSAFDIATGRGVTSKPRSWTAAYSDALGDLVDADERIVAMTAAMPGSTGLLPIAERHPDRVLDVGIAEQHMVTAAAGLAHEGRVPVVAVYSTFFSRAFDQANMDVGLHDEHVVFTFDRAGITGDDGPSHHGVLDMVLCLRIPSMHVYAPSSEQELAAQLASAVAGTAPASLRWPKGAAVQAEPGQVGEGQQALQHREGADVTIVAVGDRLWPALEAAETLAADGIDVAVWDPRVIRPVDATMLDALADAPVVVTVENGYVSGGAGAYIADRLVERTGVREAPPILRLGVPDTYISHAKPARILAELGLDAAGIDTAVRKVLGQR